MLTAAHDASRRCGVVGIEAELLVQDVCLVDSDVPGVLQTRCKDKARPPRHVTTQAETRSLGLSSQCLIRST